MGYHWHLRQKMAERSLFQTSELVPLRPRPAEWWK
jgi:hypothetical protein